jgi:type II secretory pathway component PulF
MEAIFGSFDGGSSPEIRSNIAVMEKVMLCFTGFVLLLVAAVIVLKKTGRRFPEAGRYFDYIMLRLPLAGKFLASWESLNFSFAMEVLTSGGVSVEAALGEAEGVVSNSAYRMALREVLEDVLNGMNLSQAFCGKKIFPPCLGRWTAIGESSGRTEKIFAQVRSYFQEEIDKLTDRFLLLIEPALIVLIGVVILIFVIGVVLPLFSVYGNIL